MTSWKFATTGNFLKTNLFSLKFVFFFFRIIKKLKIKISLNESVKDRKRCPAIQGFVRSIPNSDRTLCVDRPLFAALYSRGNSTRH